MEYLEIMQKYFTLLETGKKSRGEPIYEMGCRQCTWKMRATIYDDEPVAHVILHKQIGD